MAEQQPFAAEVDRVLEIVIGSLYKDREIFLRELISNAADAADKLRFAAIAGPALLDGDADLAVRITADAGAATLTVADNGIGMAADDLARNLGTIARSGTARFAEALAAGGQAGPKLIGQFGVGFYAAFMVADRVEVRSRAAGEVSGATWTSDGRSGYTVEPLSEPVPRGTAVTLHLKADAREFLDPGRLRRLVRTYSDHVALPIFLVTEADGAAAAPVQLNTAGALWVRPKAEITAEQYTEFYYHVSRNFDRPFARVHFSAEGALTYTGLLFVPSRRPLELGDGRRAHGVKLYVRRVFITDGLEELLPRYLRFVSGVVDSEDLTLNVSRETLQHGTVVPRLRKAIVRRVLDELARKATAVRGEASAPKDPSDDPDLDKPADVMEVEDVGYDEWWAAFGATLKEGLVEDAEQRPKLLELARFKSTAGAGLVSLAAYVARMPAGQDGILTISGDDAESLRSHPQLEAALAKGLEVLLLDDQVDEFWPGEVDGYDGRPFRSLTRGEVDLSTVPDREGPIETPLEDGGDALKPLLARLSLLLADQVAEVRASQRLRASAVCLVAAEHGIDLRLERLLRQHDRLPAPTKKILEVNGRHPLIARLSAMASDEGQAQQLEELARLLLDQARIAEGEAVVDGAAFSRRMNAWLLRGLG